VAYTLFVEIHEGRQASVDSKFQRTYTRVFLVGTDSGNFGPAYAGSHPSLPIIFSRHPEDIAAFCVRLSPVQDSQDPTLWRVTAEYSYNPDLTMGGGTGVPAIDGQQQGVSPASRDSRPLFRPNDYSIATSTYPMAVCKDTVVANKAIVNKAGDPFLPPLEMQRAEATITVGLNSLNAPSGAWLGSVGCVNSNTMVIGAYVANPGQAKLNSISAQFLYENGINYWRWTLVFGYRTTWAAEVLNQGLREKRGANLYPIYDVATGYKIDQPVLLTEDGEEAAAGADPIYCTFNIYPRVTFPTPL
jgi:hypothetical protein